MRGGSTEPARIVAGELFRSVTVKKHNSWSFVFMTIHYEKFRKRGELVIRESTLL